jgi:hypothetical protein
MTNVNMPDMCFMINGVSSVSADLPAAPVSRTTTKAPPTAPATKADSAVLSSAAQALKEATESAATTAKEAMAGDRQAQRLLAKEEAAAKQI